MSGTRSARTNVTLLPCVALLQRRRQKILRTAVNPNESVPAARRGCEGVARGEDSTIDRERLLDPTVGVGPHRVFSGNTQSGLVLRGEPCGPAQRQDRRGSC